MRGALVVDESPSDTDPETPPLFQKWPSFETNGMVHVNYFYELRIEVFSYRGKLVLRHKSVPVVTNASTIKICAVIITFQTSATHVHTIML